MTWCRRCWPSELSWLCVRVVVRFVVSRGNGETDDWTGDAAAWISCGRIYLWNQGQREVGFGAFRGGWSIVSRWRVHDESRLRCSRCGISSARSVRIGSCGHHQLGQFERSDRGSWNCGCRTHDGRTGIGDWLSSGRCAGVFDRGDWCAVADAPVVVRHSAGCGKAGIGCSVAAGCRDSDDDDRYGSQTDISGFDPEYEKLLLQNTYYKKKSKSPERDLQFRDSIQVVPKTFEDYHQSD